MTDYMRTVKLETLKPAIFSVPDSIYSIGIFNLSSLKKSDWSVEFMENGKLRKDTAVDYKQISSKCTEALTEFLTKEKYFKIVKNFGDSVSYLKSDTSATDIYNKLGVDACLFLEDIDFKIVALDFADMMTVNSAKIIWSILFKGDSLSYYYSQNDTLMYDNETELPMPRNQQNRISMVALSSGEYLGKAFGGKLIPTWIRVERMFYQSNNVEMLRAERFAKDNDWLKAAEIWNKMSKNENTMMAAKASYNMALACEMEGHLDPAIDWLVRSYTLMKEKNKEHQENCQRYINLLATRKKEIEKLAKQVRN